MLVSYCRADASNNGCATSYPGILMMGMMMQTKQNIQEQAENSLAAIMSYICILITNITCHHHHGRILAAQSSVTWTRVRVSVSDSGAGVRFVRIFGDTANNTWNPTRVRGIRLGKKIKTRVSG